MIIKTISVLIVLSIIEAIMFGIEERYYKSNFILIVSISITVILYIIAFMFITKNLYIILMTIFTKITINIVSVIRYRRKEKH